MTRRASALRITQAGAAAAAAAISGRIGRPRQRTVSSTTTGISRSVFFW
jgi:hypothetical protein